MFFKGLLRTRFLLSCLRVFDVPMTNANNLIWIGILMLHHFSDHTPTANSEYYTEIVRAKHMCPLQEESWPADQQIIRNLYTCWRSTTGFKTKLMDYEFDGPAEHMSCAGKLKLREIFRLYT